MSKNAAFDASIPVLTEVFQDQPVKEDVLAVVAEPVPEPLETVATDDLPAVGAGEPRFDDLESRLSERILAQLHAGALDQQIRESLQSALHHAIVELTNEIRANVHRSVEKAVAEAVAQELTNWRAEQ